jgi:hypothetical protein
VKRSQLAVVVLAPATGACAERSADGEARRYRITFVAVDADGNRDAATAIVTAPAE